MKRFKIGDQVKGIQGAAYWIITPRRNKARYFERGQKGVVVGVELNGAILLLMKDGTQIVTTENHIRMYNSLLENKITSISADKGVGLTPDQVDAIYNTVLAEMRGHLDEGDIPMAEQIIAEEIEASIKPVATANGYDYWTWTSQEGEQVYNITAEGDTRPTGGYVSAAYICSIKKIPNLFNQ